jgi:hypothetical protein
MNNRGTRCVDAEDECCGAISPAIRRHARPGSGRSDERLHDAALDRRKGTLHQRNPGVAADHPQPEVERERGRYRRERKLKRHPSTHRLPPSGKTLHANG